MSQPPTSPNWKLRARIWVLVLFIVTAGADYLYISAAKDLPEAFSFNEFNPLPILGGVVVMSALCSKLLLIGMWRRMSWTRYTLGTVLVISIIANSVMLFFIVGGKLPRQPGMVKKQLAGIALQVLALVPLAKSRSIRRQMHPMTNSED